VADALAFYAERTETFQTHERNAASGDIKFEHEVATGLRTHAQALVEDCIVEAGLHE